MRFIMNIFGIGHNESTIHSSTQEQNIGILRSFDGETRTTYPNGDVHIQWRDGSSALQTQADGYKKTTFSDGRTYIQATQEHLTVREERRNAAGELDSWDDLPARVLSRINGDLQEEWYKSGLLHRDNNRPAFQKTDSRDGRLYALQYWENGNQSQSDPSVALASLRTNVSGLTPQL